VFRVLRSALWEQKFEGFERFESLKSSAFNVPRSALWEKEFEGFESLKGSALTEIIRFMHINSNHLSGNFLVVS